MPDQSEHLGVVVGVDGSTSSSAAVRWAARWAATRNTGLTLVHASPLVVPRSSLVEWMGPTTSHVMSAQEEQARRLIDDAAKTANDTVGGLRIQTKATFAAPVPAPLEQSDEARKKSCFLSLLRQGRRLRCPPIAVLLADGGDRRLGVCGVAFGPEDCLALGFGG